MYTAYGSHFNGMIHLPFRMLPCIEHKFQIPISSAIKTVNCKQNPRFTMLIKL